MRIYQLIIMKMHLQMIHIRVYNSQIINISKSITNQKQVYCKAIHIIAN